MPAPRRPAAARGARCARALLPRADRACRCRSRPSPRSPDILPGDGNRAGQRHEPGRAVQRAGQVVGQQTEVRHAAILVHLHSIGLYPYPKKAEMRGRKGSKLFDTEFHKAPKAQPDGHNQNAAVRSSTANASRHGCGCWFFCWILCRFRRECFILGIDRVPLRRFRGCSGTRKWKRRCTRIRRDERGAAGRNQTRAAADRRWQTGSQSVVAAADCSVEPLRACSGAFRPRSRWCLRFSSVLAQATGNGNADARR